MPILEIKALPQADQAAPARALKKAAAELVTILGVRPGAVKAVWLPIAPGCYVEDGQAPAAQPAGSHPVLVKITAFAGRPPELIERALRGVAETLSRELSLPIDSFLLDYQEIPPGRLFTLGNLKR